MDINKLSSNLGLEEDEFIELVELFIPTTISDIDRLQSACESGDSEKAVDAAHSLKGAAGNLGFMELSEIAKKAENKAKQNSLDEIREVVNELKNNLDIVVKLLEKAKR